MGSSGCRINRRLPFATGNPTFLLSRVGPDAKRAPVTQADVPRAGALVACLSALELRGSCLQGINFVRGRRSLSTLNNALLNLFSDTAFTSQVATGSILVASAEKLGKLRRGILSELGNRVKLESQSCDTQCAGTKRRICYEGRVEFGVGLAGMSRLKFAR